MECNFMERIVPGDETWVFGYDPKTKRQSSQRNLPESPRSKKTRQVHTEVKALLIVCFVMEGVVHHEYVPEGGTVNQHYAVEFLER
jgi:hypothetical protein